MPKKKTTTGPRRELVEKGDFPQLLNQMLERSLSLACPDQDLKLLARAIRNSAAVDPGKLTDDTLTSAITFASYMFCRVQYTVFRKIQDHDQRHQSMPPGLPPDVAQEWLPRTERIVRLLMDLGKTQTTIRTRREKHDRPESRKQFDLGADSPQAAEPQNLPGEERMRTSQGPVLHGDDRLCGEMAGTSVGRTPRAA